MLKSFLLQDSTFTRFVQVGRIVLIRAGPSAGRIAVIAEIIDHKRAIIEGPTSGVPRQSFPYKHLSLTPHLISDLPRGASSKIIKKYLTGKKEDKDGNHSRNWVKKWEESKWAKSLESKKQRSTQTDFGRFETMLRKKARRDVIRKGIRKEKLA